MSARWVLVMVVACALAPGLATGAEKAAGRKPPGKAASAAKGDSAMLTREDPTKNRRLQDIHIEGEIPVPQVLFITAREQRRVLDFDHKRYRRSGAELARGTPVPKRVTVSKTPPAPAPQAPESSR
jgi:hypothetical protein